MLKATQLLSSQARVLNQVELLQVTFHPPYVGCGGTGVQGDVGHDWSGRNWSPELADHFPVILSIFVQGHLDLGTVHQL